MIDAYEFNQRTFSTKGPQCVYSARELTRWCRALEQASDNCSNASALVRLWLHEGLRLFADRLPEMTDVQTCDDALRAIAQKRFPVSSEALEPPIALWKVALQTVRADVPVQAEALRRI